MSIQGYSMKNFKATICLMLLLLPLFIGSFAVNVQAQAPFTGSVIIRSDGSIDPSSAPIRKSGETYTFLDSFTGNITIQKDNIVLDGASFRINTTGIGAETTIGINLAFRRNVTVTNLQVSDFVQGIHLLNSTNCTLIGNNLTANIDGIRIDNSTGNFIIGNNITANRHGVHPFKDNVFYHNNFMNSSDKNVFFDSPSYVDVWDNGYPAGGNYWDNYTGLDEKRGSSQNETGSDGIGDTPHTIEFDNKDNFPLMVPYTYVLQTSAQPDLLWAYLMIGVIVIAVAAVVGVVFLRKRMKKQI
jgi:parallel beta-helix repeat protein